MLAKLPLFKSVCFSFGSLAISCGLIFQGTFAAQQTTPPSQRYQPVRANTSPVYNFQAPARGEVLQDAQRLPTSQAPAPAPSINETAYYPERFADRTTVQTASYQEPSVPDILSQGRIPVDPALQSQGPASKALNSNTDMLPARTPQQYQRTLGFDSQIEPTGVAPSMTTGNQPIQLTSQRATQTPMLTPQPTANVPVNVAPQAEDKKASTDVSNGLRSQAMANAATRSAPENPAAFQGDSETSGREEIMVSASEFVAGINQQQPQTPANSQSESPRLVAKQGSTPVSPAMQMASELPLPGEFRDTQVQPASANTTGNDDTEQTDLRLSSPAIDVETIGPKTIGINKPTQYQVRVRNNSIIKAERILVGIDLPSWVEIENVSLTSGGKELTDGNQKARLVWSVDQIPGNSTQTMTITAIPRKAEMFDVGVEWTLVPRMGKTAVRVTEPKLQMSISGPREVLFGETALYHVTVRNPGTGDAENVTIMLPEALGGERASLGNIPAGKEENLQVELVARTAGDLNLIATATAEGNLTTSGERQLTVRRAKLDVAMTGPPLKYAGGVGEYSVTISNKGDATATEVVAAVALPPGVKYLEGIEAVKLIQGGMKWTVGSIDPGDSRTYKMFCQLDTSGDLKLEVGTKGKGELAAAGVCMTTVETIADLVLSVADPKGPLPTGERVPYVIKIRNRGTRAAKDVDLTMLFSEGIEPRSAKGLEHQIVPGKGTITFAPISEIAPGQEVSFEVYAEGIISGTHVFRAKLTCEESDSHEMTEGTTRFFGDRVAPTRQAQAPDDKAFSIN